MKSKLICWCVFFTLVIVCLPVTASAASDSVGVAYRGHIQDRGDYPTDGGWLDSPEIIGTEAQSKRIEGFEIKLTGAVPEGMELRYNVHVQNKGWLYNEDDSADWPKDGAYAGTKGKSLRIEAVKIVLTDASGQPFPGYSIEYRGHVQNVGNLPEDETQWIKDGEQLGTVGSSLRLEALLVKVVEKQIDLAAYKALLTAIEKTIETDYTASTWEILQKALTDNVATAENSQLEINKATAAIQNAYDGLEKKAAPVVYDKAGTYGPETGTEVINGDVIVKVDGIKLRNLLINGDLYIGEEQVTNKTEESALMEDNQITTETATVQTQLENTFVEDFTRLFAGTGISISGGLPSGISAQEYVFLIEGRGTEFSFAGDIANGETALPLSIHYGGGGSSPGGVEIGGDVGGLRLITPGAQFSVAPSCRMELLTVPIDAFDCTVAVSSSAVIQELIVQGMGATFSGSGRIQHANIQADGASFSTRPDTFTVAPGVVDQPIMPAPPSDWDPTPPSDTEPELPPDREPELP